MVFQPKNLFDILGYVVSIFVLLVGIAMIFGLLLNQTPSNYRILFGVVLVLYGIYRFVTLRIKQKKSYSNDV